MLAGSFILLGVTGLFVRYSRDSIAPTFGPEFNAQLLLGSKFVHNNVAWAFMLALVMVFEMWVWHNIPNRTGITWFAQSGGIIGNKHPPTKKFNAGQKIIFWSVILLGGSISVSGLSLLFPFDLPLFAKTFTALNEIGISSLPWLGTLPPDFSPQEEMQFAQARRTDPCCTGAPLRACKRGRGAGLHHVKGHGGPIMDLAVSPGEQIASASFDNSVGL